MTTSAVASVEHGMTRLNIHTGIRYEVFLEAFESAAPPFDPERFADCRTWPDVVDTMAAFAPYGLTVYARIDTRQMMALAGSRVQAVEYLLGNHVIAETMFRRDPNALLYAPLRVLVYTDDAGNAVFAIDRPSTVFAGLHDPQIAETGHLLDGKVAGLLDALGVSPPAALAGGSAP